MLSRARRRVLGALIAGALLVATATFALDHDTGAPAAVAGGAVPTITSSTSTTLPPTTTTAPPPRATAAPRPVTTVVRPSTTRRPAPAPAPTSSDTGVVAAFYYGWYGPTGLGPSRYHPVAANHDAKDPAVVARHIAQMRYGGIQAGIASWWGPGHATDDAFPIDLAAAAGTPFTWSLYYELEGPGYPNLAPDQLRASLQYIVDRYTNHPNFLRVDGRPVIFVWPDPGDRCEMIARWNAANTFGLHIVHKRFSGHSGCAAQPQSWHDYSPDRFAIEVKPWSLSVGPGFWHYDESSPRLARNPASFENAVRAMAASPAMWKLVTTFNEWREGTAVEPATEWASPSGYGVYLDILHSVLGSR